MKDAIDRDVCADCGAPLTPLGFCPKCDPQNTDQEPEQ